MSFRSRWYSERNLPYEPPKLINVPPFFCVGYEVDPLYKRLTGGELGKRVREVGDDDDVPQSWEV